MDKQWMNLRNRFSKEYFKGVSQFMEFSAGEVDSLNRLRCPCVDCGNLYFHPTHIVTQHLVLRGMDKSYTTWNLHGERVETNRFGSRTHEVHAQMNDVTMESDDEGDEIHELLEDLNRGQVASNVFMGSNNNHDEEFGSCQEDDYTFTQTMRDAQIPLYEGCAKFSKLSFIVKLLLLKVSSGINNNTFEELLKLLTEAFPFIEKFPKNYYDAKKVIRNLGLSYERIHACKNDCVLFWKEHEHKQECPVCGYSRWVHGESNRLGKKKVPQKVLFHFPLKPRLRRLFMSRKTAEEMRWHKEKRLQEENVLRHPADSATWKKFDIDHCWFAEDPRNVRLGLATDGFNPFGNMSNAYSVWPVILIPYNFPPWMSMKESFFIMSLLIPGPKSPGNDIDVYLQPLIEELKDLWEIGVPTYDAYKKETFNMHAAVLWTINDFPAYGNLSGWSTKGKKACPNCNKDTDSQWLTFGGKHCYMGHRRFLPQNHFWRKRTMMFNGKQDHRLKPKEYSGDDILEQLNHIGNITLGKTRIKLRGLQQEKMRKKSKRPRKDNAKKTEKEFSWLKRSIFFNLPYWRTLLVRHNLDVMHIEKNVCESVLNTIMNVGGKSKDNMKARKDCQQLNVRPELHEYCENGKTVVPHASFTLSRDQCRELCDFIKSVKFPDGFASNISRCVNNDGYSISGLKSHDCHIFLQRILPVAIRGLLREDVSRVLIQLCYFFKELCCKTLRLPVLENMERDIALILCKLETIFPPAFFDSMIHLPIHLADEARLAGPVQYRWMYPIERYLRTLKCYVRNKARPEGSIAEAYIANECVIFCSLYLQTVQTRFNREERNNDGPSRPTNGTLPVFRHTIRPLGCGEAKILSRDELRKAHLTVLNNCEELKEYIDEHYDILETESPHKVDQRHADRFPDWFGKRGTLLHNQNSKDVSEDIYYLACGPDSRVTRYSGCISNGSRFHTAGREMFRRTQNSGVVVKGVHKDEEILFYGILDDVISLSYAKGRHVYLFQCTWWDVGHKTGFRKDEHFTSVNFSRTWYPDDPYVLASQVSQVFYVRDIKLGGEWHIVQKLEPRNIYDVVEQECSEELDIIDENLTVDAYQEGVSNGIGGLPIDEGEDNALEEENNSLGENEANIKGEDSDEESDGDDGDDREDNDHEEEDSGGESLASLDLDNTITSTDDEGDDSTY